MNNTSIETSKQYKYRNIETMHYGEQLLDNGLNDNIDSTCMNVPSICKNYRTNGLVNDNNNNLKKDTPKS